MFNPERLVLARNARRINQEELATRIDYSASTVSRWESGSNSPSAEALIKLSQELKLPERWFGLKLLEDNSVYQFRSLKRTDVSARDKAKARLTIFHEITHAIEQWVDYPALNIVDSPNHIEVVNMTDEKIELLAEKQRQLWKLGNRPIKNLTRLLESSGVMITKDWLSSKDMDGVSTWIKDRPYILVAEDKGNYFRNRFDNAHEFGHIVLHKNLTHEECKNIGHNEIERQANYFASCLLMPSESLSLSYRNITLENLLIEKRHWRSSVAALIMRNHSLGLIDDDHKTRLFRNYSYRKWRHGEPYDADYQPESPELMHNTINLLLSDGGLHKEDIMDKTFYYAEDLEQLCCLPTGIFSDSPIDRRQKLKILT
jgi:Zn-dependent peptidase ImmA (M78 family)